MSIESTLAERGNRYGDFTDHADLAQGIQFRMQRFCLKADNADGFIEPWKDHLNNVQRQALTVIADKIARILSGDPDYADNWHDIQGYAKLVEDRLPKTEQQEHTDTLAQFDERRDALRGGSGGGSHTVVLPDGSAFGVVSFPLSKDHWLYADRAYEDGADQPKELPSPILNHGSRETVVAAARYAVRGATNCGKEPDFDPDALVQNMVYALCGPYGGAFVQPPEASIDPADVDISDEAAPSKHAPDPYDWYTWKPGDLLVCEQRYSEGRGEPAINVGDFVRVLKVEDRDCVDDLPVHVNHDVLGDIWPDHEDYDAKGDDKPLRRIFRFHSRPTK